MVGLVRKFIAGLLVVVWLSLGATPAQAGPATPPPPPPASTAPPRLPAAAAAGAPTPGTAAEIERYAARQRQAGQLETFEGGARIGTTTIIVILLLVIVILLLVR
jgi:hypothetical protein